jgi:hypothetical protein
MNGALALWLLGRPVQALEWAEEGLALAVRLDNPRFEAQALGFATLLHHFRREPDAAAARAQAVVALAVEHGLAPHRAAMATVIEAWSQVMRQRVDEGAALAHRGPDELRSLEHGQRLAYVTSVVAECDAAVRRNGAALGTLEAAFDAMR